MPLHKGHPCPNSGEPWLATPSQQGNSPPHGRAALDLGRSKIRDLPVRFKREDPTFVWNRAARQEGAEVK